MVMYVRIRTVKAGKFQGAIEFLRRYKDFTQTALGTEVKFGAEVGQLGRIVSIANFENAQAWEDALNNLRSNPEYVQLLDESAAYFEDEVAEHLVTEVPL